MEKIEIKIGDITKEQVDAIVNAANTSLIGGGGVNAAIHHAAGPELLAECATLGGCLTGQAKLTKGYNLPAKFIIHTPGPVWHGGRRNEEQLLSYCYRNALNLAVQYNFKTIAFPAISTGLYEFPRDRAAKIALQTVKEFLARHPQIEKIIFVCFTEDSYQVYQHLIDNQ